MKTFLSDRERERVDAMTVAEKDAADGHDAVMVAIRALELRDGKTAICVPEGLKLVKWDEGGRQVVAS